MHVVTKNETQLRDIPKDVIIQHIIPHIQKSLIKENNHLKSLVTKLSVKLRHQGVSICEHPDGCFKDVVELFECNACERMVCKGHLTNSRYHYRLYSKPDENFLHILGICETCKEQELSPSNCECKLCDLSLTSHLIIDTNYYWNGSSWVLQEKIENNN